MHKQRNPYVKNIVYTNDVSKKKKKLLRHAWYLMMFDNKNTTLDSKQEQIFYAIWTNYNKKHKLVSYLASDQLQQGCVDR